MTGMDMHASGEVNQTGPKTLIGKIRGIRLYNEAGYLRLLMLRSTISQNRLTLEQMIEM